MKSTQFLIAIALTACAMSAQLALGADEAMPAMQHAMKPKGDDSASSQAFRAAGAKMHADMDVTYTGNADADFIKGMMPHHQGAIDAAKIELQYGKDSEARKLAEGIIKAQESEIAFMTDWLKKTAPK